MCVGGAIGDAISPITSKRGRAAMLGGLAGTLLAGKKKRPSDPMQPNLPTTNLGG